MAKVGVLLYGKTLITVLLLGLVTSGCSRKQPPNAGPPPEVPVKLQSVQTGTVEEYEELPVSKLEAAKRVELRPEAEGRISQIFVSSGTPVAKGTPIAQLRPEKGRAEVGGAIAAVNQSRAALNNARAQLKAAEAERVRAVADLELQNQQYKRISILVSQGAYARQQLDQVQRDRDAARAALNAAEENIQAARATIDQENSAVQQAKANVALRTEELNDTQVVAPIPGVVGDVRVKLGAYVETSDILTTIIQNDTLELSLPIPDKRTSQLRIGLPVQLLNPQNRSPLATGRISFISPQVDNTSLTILAKATFPNPEGILRDGQVVTARVIWSSGSSVLIPTTAISRVAGQNFVFVAQEQGKSQQGKPQLVARQKLVKLGKTQVNNIQVLEGLKPGETIVVSGILNLKDGTPIIPQP